MLATAAVAFAHTPTWQRHLVVFLTITLLSLGGIGCIVVVVQSDHSILAAGLVFALLTTIPLLLLYARIPLSRYLRKINQQSYAVSYYTRERNKLQRRVDVLEDFIRRLPLKNGESLTPGEILEHFYRCTEFTYILNRMLRLEEQQQEEPRSCQLEDNPFDIIISSV